jgi:hypothetical protein
MKGLIFKLNEDKKMQSSLGYDRIHVIDKYLFRKRLVNHDKDNECVRYYDYILDVIGTNDRGNRRFFQLIEDELQDEISYDIYQLEI